jgi:YVTN family beta-propeller protein
VANLGDNTVSVIDVASDTVVGAPITVGIGPLGLAITSDGARVYVTNANTTTVSVVDVATKAVVGTITVGSSPEGIAVTPCTVPLTPLEPTAPAPAALTAAPRFTG